MGWSCPSTAACRPSESADLGECMFVKALTEIRWITKVGISEVGASGAVESWETNVNTDWRSIMSYAIVGFGKIGQALAHAFARKNIDVTVASRRPPEALAPQARAIGSTVVAKSLRDALEADTIILAVPFGEHREVAKALPSWKGKTVIDAMNALVPPEELDGLLSSAFVAKSFTGAKVVKGFNHLVAAILATDPIVEGGHRVVFLSSDDEDAIAPVADLAKELGFAPVKLGKLNEGGALVHARGRTWGRLIFQDLFKKEQ
jgi:predicted dinucleotide-binding enzyme